MRNTRAVVEVNSEKVEVDAGPQLVEFWPQRLREAGTDPVSVLDGYRAMWLAARGAEGELPSDPGELVRAVDAAEQPFTTLRLVPVDSPSPAHERLLPAGRRLGRTWARRFPPSAEPGTLAYDATHRALVRSLLESEPWAARFAAGEQLPAGLGAGFDERVVEFPWLAAQRLGGRVLDAGSTLNHLHVLARLRPRVDDLHIVTLAPEAEAFPQLGISYLFADLRALPFADAVYDRVLSISTLEHVGTDTTFYGGETRVAEDPQRELLAAVAELRRVLRPGGDCYITVPVGRGERFEWVRSLTPAQVDEIAAAFEPEAFEAEYFRYADGGWRRSDREGVADARYRDHFTSDGLGPDGVVAAEAVACLHLVKAG
jgi:SAM-dependent methyltransferase